MKEPIWNKKEEKLDFIYDIQEHKGYPNFLIYDEKNGWKYMSAKHFIPIMPRSNWDWTDIEFMQNNT